MATHPTPHPRLHPCCAPSTRSGGRWASSLPPWYANVPICGLSLVGTTRHDCICESSAASVIRHVADGVIVGLLCYRGSDPLSCHIILFHSSPFLLQGNELEVAALKEGEYVAVRRFVRLLERGGDAKVMHVTDSVLIWLAGGTAAAAQHRQCCSEVWARLPLQFCDRSPCGCLTFELVSEARVCLQAALDELVDRAGELVNLRTAISRYRKPRRRFRFFRQAFVQLPAEVKFSAGTSASHISVMPDMLLGLSLRGQWPCPTCPVHT